MAKPYHIKLKRTTENLDNTNIQNYTDLKWGEPIVTNDGYIAVGDKTGSPDDNGDYQSGAVSTLKVFTSVAQTLKDKFTFWKAGTSAPVTGTHVTLIDENSNNISPDTDANYVAYNGSTTYTNGTVGKAVSGKLDLAGGTMTGDINMGGHKVTNLASATPTANTDVANKGYVDSQSASAATTAVNAAVSGTANYLAKFTSAHVVGNGPAISSTGSAVKFLNEKGDWATIPAAANGTRGGIQIGYTTDATNRNYAVQLSSEKAFVNVPWQDTNNAVTQTNTTGNADYRILFSYNANDTNETVGARKNTSFKYNPSTGNLTVTKINGAAVGSDPKFSDNDTKNTAGSTNSTSKIFLIGATSQAANPQTYSNSAVYVTNGTLTATTVSATTGTFTNLTKGGAAVATESYVNTKVQGISPFTYVTSLPTSGISETTIYVLETSVTSGSTTYKEYVPYIRHNNAWLPLSGTW